VANSIPFPAGPFLIVSSTKVCSKVTVKLGPGLVLNIWNVHLQDGGPLGVRQSQVRELVSLVQGADDNQIADVVGGDFNCTPGSALCQELENSLGPSVVQLGNIAPFITWDALSPKPGAGETLDYIFVHRRVSLQNLEAVTQVAFTAPTQKQRLSDHLGIESVLRLRPADDLAGTLKPQLQSTLLPSLSFLQKRDSE
jgi:endonuclease/exonuclease/phosphatase family metal-dependent hydrolase